jgi:succinate-semialdehyde dehydrogenase/glutarate-semialdehyde dehydrogenase
MPNHNGFPGASLVESYLVDEPGLTVFDPATGLRLGTVADTAGEDVALTIEAAHASFPAWAELTAKARAAILRRWHDLILANMEDLAQLATAECGKPLAESRGEVAYAASFVEWFAEEGKRIYGDVIPHHAAGKRILTLKQPVGVAAAITPWNFPLAMLTRKAGPALAAGCPMIVKPAETTPLSALALEALAHQAGIPKDVFRVLTTSNPAAIGRIFTEHPLVRKVSFTGSTAVGKKLMAQSASTVKKVSMELGGNAPFIVFDDADIDAAVNGALVSKYRNAGQTCVCANRFLVQTGVHDRFVDALSKRVADLKVGHGADDGTQIGPLINIAGVEKVGRLVSLAIEQGARAAVGAIPHKAGSNFYTPTVLVDVTTAMDIANAEIFGPVAPVIRFETEAEAIRIANDTPYGLAAYFYTRDLGRVFRVMEALEYGIVGVNDGLISTEVAPFGGVKESGIGREGSRYGIDEYVQIKYCLIGGLSA